MTSARRFVASRTLVGFQQIQIDGRPVVEEHDRLRRTMRQRSGNAVAELFAEPVMSRSNGAAPARIDWYTNLDGPIRSLADLEPAEADRLRQRTQAALSMIEPLLYDPEAGALTAACLNFADPQALLAVGDAPLLIDWGLLPQALVADERGRLSHFKHVLAGSVPDRYPYPPISCDDWVARFHPLPAKPRGEPPAALPKRHKSPLGPVSVAPAVAVAIAAALVALSYVPGALVFPQAPRVISGEARAADAAWLDGLRRRREALAVAEGYACPRLRTELPTLVPQSPASIRVPSDPATPPRARAALETPASPSAAQPPGLSETDGLVDRLERSTVLIVAGDATGSGFFVADDLVVTNRHVVEGAASVMVAGRHAGIVPATLVRTGEPGTLTDFALLRVPARSGGRPLKLAPPGRALTPVVGAGFPGLYLGTDPTFARLREGDATASRDLVPVLQTGVINHLQRYDEAAVTLVLHGAEIAPGNSGGPLVDYCGRVVGVNTFGRTDDRLPVTARYALGADGLAAFLTGAGVEAGLDTRGCDLQAPASPPVTAAAEQAEPAPSPSPVPGPSPAQTPAPAGPTTSRPDARQDNRAAPRTGRDARPPAR